MVIKFLTRNGLYLILAFAFASVITAYYTTCNSHTPVEDVVVIDSVTTTIDSTFVDTILTDTLGE